MKNVNITSLKHLKELLNQYPDDRQVYFQCSIDGNEWYSLPAYIGEFGSLALQICPTKNVLFPAWIDRLSTLANERNIDLKLHLGTDLYKSLFDKGVSEKEVLDMLEIYKF
jgi:hypothetical protein